MARIKPLTRDQLAMFLPSHEAIKAFERIMNQSFDILPDDVETLYRLIGETSTESASAGARAQQAVDTLTSVAQRAKSNEVLLWLSM